MSSTRSQAPSDISFRDLFSPSENTTPSKRNAAPTALSPNRLAAELLATQKELKRVKHKYYALYDAQEEILRKREKDRDKWRHFKLVVKNVCAARPEFQDALKEADASMKKDKQIQDDVQSAPVKSVDIDTSVEKETATSMNAEAARLTGTSIQRPSRNDTFASPRKPLRTPERRTQVPKPVQLITSPRPLASPPQSPSPKKRTIRSVTRASPDLLLIDNNQKISPRVKAEPSEEEHERLQLVDDCLADDAEAAVRNAEAEAELARQQEVIMAEEEQERLDKQMLELICAEYVSLSGLSVPKPHGDTSALWKLDGQEVKGPALPALQGTAGFEGQDHSAFETQPLPSISQPSTCDKLSFWSEAEGSAKTASQQSVPTDIEFGSYLPSTADIIVTDASMQSDIDNAPALELPAASSPVPTPTRPTSRPRASPYSVSLLKRTPHLGSVPYLFPLPADLQPRIPADQDILEESMPVHRINRPRSRNSSILSPPFAPEFRKCKPFEFRLRRELSKADSATTQEKDSAVDDLPPCDDEATEPSSESSEEGNGQGATGCQGAVSSPEDAIMAQPEKGQEVTPSASTVPASSTVKSRSASTTSATSPLKKTGPPTAHEDKGMEFVTVQNDTRADAVEPADAQTAEGVRQPMPIMVSKPVLPRLSSYRPSKGMDSDEEYSTRSISDEIIGPRRALAPASAVRGKPASTSASRMLGVPEPQKEGLCGSLYTKITAGAAGDLSIDNPMPLGKAIAPLQAQMPASAIPRGTPTAWLNMSSKKRNGSIGISFGTPSHSPAPMSFKQAKDTSKASETVKTRQSTIQQLQRITTPVDEGRVNVPATKGQVSHKSVHTTLAAEVRQEVRDTSPARAKSKAPGSSLRLSAHETAAGVKKSTIKKARKSAAVDDPDVQSDLDMIGAVIMKGSGGTFRLGQKRAPRTTAASDAQSHKKTRLSSDLPAAEPYIEDVKPPQARIDLILQDLRKQSSSDAALDTKTARRSASRGFVCKSDAGPSKQPLAAVESKRNGELDAKMEESGAGVSEEESEEYKGQRFMREIHKLRKEQMLQKVAGTEGRAADERATEQSARPKVAYKETIRGREARQAMHGIDCDCCKGVSLPTCRPFGKD